jgi:L-ascorbate metabolism protein UlaG (beta-lactamase superfamily)
MNITKLGHCCLVLDINGIKILTDPGSFTTAQNTLTGLSILLITHEHGDHYHVESVAAVVKNNPDIEVVCNKAVAALIQKENIPCKVSVVGDGESVTLQGVLIEGFGTEHAKVYGDMPNVENTGYMVAGTFYFPGDNFYPPAGGAGNKAVEVLALPVAGPWMKIAEAVDFAKTIKAPKAFGVHDGMIVPPFRGFVGMILKNFVPETEYTALADGESKEF